MIEPNVQEYKLYGARADRCWCSACREAAGGGAGRPRAGRREGRGAGRDDAARLSPIPERRPARPFPSLYPSLGSSYPGLPQTRSDETKRRTRTERSGDRRRWACGPALCGDAPLTWRRRAGADRVRRAGGALLSSAALEGRPRGSPTPTRSTSATLSGTPTTRSSCCSAAAPPVLRPAARKLELDDGRALAYDDLLIATGAAPRSLPVPRRASKTPILCGPSPMPAASAARSGRAPASRSSAPASSARRSRRRGGRPERTCRSSRRSSCRSRHVLGPEIGRRLVDMHREQGVRIHLAPPASSTALGNGRVERLELSSGARIDCDVVVVGVGAAPAAGWLAGSGLETDGILTDEASRTSVPHVYAAGDVSRPFDPRLGEHTRTEHWDAASRQGQRRRDRDARRRARARRPHRASGATSTGCGSSTRATHMPPIRFGSRARRAGPASPRSTTAADGRSPGSPSDARASSPPCAA